MTSAPSIKVLVAEDHFLARLALTTVLADQPDIEVVAAASSGLEAVNLHRSHQPDVTLMDLRLPELDGCAAIAEIRRATPAARILVVSQYESEEDIHRALSAGAMGYLRKDTSGEALIEAIRQVHQGLQYLPTSVMQRLQERQKEIPLTPRELEVLQLLFRGLGNKEIGGVLSLTVGTVRFYVGNILAKMGVERRGEAVAEALRRGLITEE